MTTVHDAGSPRREELLERAYAYVLEHGLHDLSLRPLSAAIGSSPRVLLYLFGSKDGLLAALLARARADELGALAAAGPAGSDLAERGRLVWRWLAAPERRGLLRMWLECYTRSLSDDGGPWAGFASRTVADWLDLLRPMPAGTGSGTAAAAPETGDGGGPEPTLVLAVLRGALLDLLATGDEARVTTAVVSYLSGL